VVDTDTARGAGIAVETWVGALYEAGDLLIPIADGAMGPDDVVADLAELVHGTRVRTGPADVTMFESVGLAFEDLAVAAALAGPA
jgi:ornithine cyclodeaminase/alanine dehydrogenase-like protein (mu-crystallin family)